MGFPWRAAALLLLLSTLLFPAVPGRADVAPPESAPGSNLLPGAETTQVRMVSETVTLVVRPRGTGRWLGQAQVTAGFQMHNLGEAVERMDVRFPLTFWTGASDGFGDYPEIDDLRVKVNGREAPTRRITTPGSDEIDERPVPWAAFDVTFPPGEDIQIEVTYTADGYGEAPYLAFRYVVETGAGWKDTIGSADFIVRLPYEATPHNVVFAHTGFSHLTPGAALVGNEVRWHFEDLEPEREDNLEISLIVPELWQQVLADRERVARSPNDGEAWGRLGKAYKEMSRLRRDLREDEGGLDLYRLSDEAYAKSIALKPNDSLWHYGYADLLWFRYYWYDFWVEHNPDTSELVRIVKLLQRALELDPGNERALALAEEIGYSVDGSLLINEGQVDYLILTATPDIRAQFPGLETPTQVPTETPPAPPATATPTMVASETTTPKVIETQAPDTAATGTAAVPADTPTGAPIAAEPAGPPAGRTRLPFCAAPLALPLAILVLAGAQRWLPERPDRWPL